MQIRIGVEVVARAAQSYRYRGAWVSFRALVEPLSAKRRIRRWTA